MGLFSFFKRAGSKVLRDEEKKAEESKLAQDIAKKAKIAVLNGVVQSLALPIDNLDVDLEDDVVTVYGTTESHEDREKIVLALGNVHGIATVDDRINVDAPEPTTQFYTVEKGDSLSKIAKKFYGDAMKYPVIFEANKPMLENPDAIYPGQNLRIPELIA